MDFFGSYATVVSWFIVLPPILALAVLTVELFIGLFSRGKARQQEPPHRDITFLVPAHQEDEVIAGTVSAMREAAPFAKIVVVADNCSDETASKAREAGAEVIERTDCERRGKGYALAFGREHLSASPPRALLIVDADCRILAGSAEAVITALESNRKPVQTSNLFCPDLAAPPAIQISNFAMLVKNLFRMRGMYRWGGSAAMLGTGSGFLWDDFQSLQLATDDSAEDIKLTVDLVKCGNRFVFVEEAEVFSPAESTGDTQLQRKRWEHGFIGHALTYAFPLIGRGLVKRSRAELALGLHMMVPPLALLILMSCISGFLAACLILFGASTVPSLMLAALLFAVGCLLTVAWLTRGRQYLAGKTIFALPAYVLWKLPIYLAFLWKRQKAWD